MEGLKIHLGFKDHFTEEKYESYNFKKKEGILKIQRGAIAVFSFLGVFHLIYLQPKKKEFSQSSEAYLALSILSLLLSVLMGIDSEISQRLRKKDWYLLITNLVLNFILIEPNFLRTAESREISKTEHFWIGFRISSINLVSLICYNSFLYKLLQMGLTVIFLMIRLKDDITLHSLLVDNAIWLMIGVFFYIKVKGERMTYEELFKIRLQSESLKEFLRFLPEGVAIFTRDYNSIFMNESVKKIFQSSSEEEIKGSILSLKRRDLSNLKNSNLSSELERDTTIKTQFVHIFDQLFGEKACSKARRELEHFKPIHEFFAQDSWKEMFYTHHKGKYLDLKFTPIYFEDTEAMLVLTTDITHSINSHMLATEESKKYRDMLFSSFSHEIRTPLNCILLLLGKARKKTRKLPEKFLSKYISPSFHSGQILLHLVNNILDYSFLLQGELKLRISEIDIKAECLEIMEVIAMQAKLKGIGLLLKLDQNLPSVIKTDGSRLKQILCHLLLNALKFTYKGQITLKVTLSKEYRNGIAVTVKDTGIGMTPEVQQRLKEKLRVSLFSSLRGITGKQSEGGMLALKGVPDMTIFTPFKVAEEGAGASLKTLLCQSLSNVIGFQSDDGLKFRSVPHKGSQFRFIVRNYSEGSETASSNNNMSPGNEQFFKEEVLESDIRVLWVPGEKYVSEKNYSDFISSSSKDIQAVQPKTSNFFCSPVLNLPSIEHVEDEEDDHEELASEQRNRVPHFQSITSKNSFSSPKSSKNAQSRTAPCLHSKILVVDDDEFNILAVTSILKRKAFSVSCARNGMQAIELINQEVDSRKNCCHKFSLILMDLNMPVMGGLEATRILKQDMAERKIPWMPIIGCTAFVGSSNEALCLGNGMDGYETKPLNERKLLSLMERWL